jgi:predicted nucleic acid-binding protein
MSRRRLLDTSWLAQHWHDCGGHSPGPTTTRDAERWARRLAQLRRTDAIVSPVVIEFLAGVRTERELKLARAYLSRFNVIDEGRILEQDWEQAKRLAERIPRDGKPRQLGDCLVRALAIRLRYDVDTLDRRFAR